MAYASRKPIRWGEVLAHPKDYELGQIERKRKAHANAWSDSAYERDGRVGTFEGGVIGLAYDARAELLEGVTPNRVTLSKQAHVARQQREQDMRSLRQTLGRANNRQGGGGR